jgi:predicted acetyltransferase
MLVRMAQEEDIEILARIGCESFPTGYGYDERIIRYRNNLRRAEEDILVGEEDGEIVVALRGIPYTIWIAGAPIEMYGIASVSNALAARRRGHASELCIAAIKLGRERGFPVSILYPFRFNFYRKLGWGTLGELIEYNFHPGNLPNFPARKQTRRLQASDLPRVAACYQRFVERGNCLAERKMTFWQKWHNDINERKTIAMVYDCDGKITGYLNFEFEPGHHMLSQVLIVNELIYDDRESYQGLLGFLASLSDQITIARYWAQRDEGFHFMLNDPRDAKQPILDGLVSRVGQYGLSYMFRVLDVAAALSARPNYNNANGSISFQISDHQVAENHGGFRLTLADGKPQVTSPVNDAPINEQIACVTLSIDIFSQLYAGALSASRAYFLGLLETDNVDALNWLDDVLRLPPPFLLDQF